MLHQSALWTVTVEVNRKRERCPTGAFLQQEHQRSHTCGVRMIVYKRYVGGISVLSMENLPDCMGMGKEEEEEEGLVVGHCSTMINVFEDGVPATERGQRVNDEMLHYNLAACTIINNTSSNGTPLQPPPSFFPPFFLSLSYLIPLCKLHVKICPCKSIYIYKYISSLIWVYTTSGCCLNFLFFLWSLDLSCDSVASGFYKSEQQLRNL